jgi:N-carbamoyl-L-amino-acid hydrolase
VVGVLGGLEAIRALQRSGFQPKRAIELILFTSEEPTRFGIGCLGSRVLSGTLTPETARQLKDNLNQTLVDTLRSAGMAGDLDSVRLPAACYHAFVELHIEQGPLLERAKIPLGVVASIAAPASLEVRIEGAGGHAGGMLMPGRKDALCAASEIILAVEEAARASESTDTVATVGICEVFPGAVNSIPSRVRLTLDLRDTELPRRDKVLQSIKDRAQQISENRGVSVQFHTVNADAPATCAAVVTDALVRAARKHNLPYQMMVSRAYHDSLFMSRIAPTGMLFVPCRDGYSHRPDEFASTADIGRGVLVLAETLAGLAS